MLKKKLLGYQELPIMSEQQINKLKSSILYYDQLVITPYKFQHPGSKDVLQPWMNKDISEIFHAKSHSFNARLLLISLTIGRKQQKRGLGYKLFQQIKEQKLSVLHEKVINQIDLSHGVLTQLSKFTPQEIEAFVTIPKYFTNSSEIMFTESKWQQFLYQDRFWISTTIFSVVFIFCSMYLHMSNGLLNSKLKITLFLFGLVAWTLIQYVFHRFVLHVPIISGKIINGHFIHHAFPNLRNKLALSVSKNLLYQFVVYLLIVYIGKVQSQNALHLLLGVHFLMISYDILHYYFHFGPEMKIPIVSKLRKNHMKHHFRDSDRGFGVTNTFWDWVFGTRHVI